MDTKVLKVADFKSDLRGCLEASMASEAVGGNINMDTKVIKVADFKFEVK